jgi:hypothetical protein
MPRKATTAAAAEPAAEPKLTLDLSERTFLSAAVVDAFSQRTLYILETRDRDTYLLFVPPDGTLQSNAQIHWPRAQPADGAPRVRVQMRGGRWNEAQDFLRFGAVFTSVRCRAPISHGADVPPTARASSRSRTTRTRSSGRRSAAHTT